jgi:hypothetical protein
VIMQHGYGLKMRKKDLNLMLKRFLEIQVTN